MARRMLVGLVFAAFAWSQIAIGQQKPGGLVGDLLTDVADVESKITSLATALPEPAWAWRPSTGVRSSAEVIVHVAADNYVIPAALGITVPAGIGIDVKRFESVAEYEKRSRTRQQAMSELVIDLSSEFLSIEGPELAKAFAQMVWTVTEVDAVDQVRFLVDGEPIRAQNAEGAEKDGAVMRRDYIIIAPR